MGVDKKRVGLLPWVTKGLLDSTPVSDSENKREERNQFTIAQERRPFMEELLRFAVETGGLSLDDIIEDAGPSDLTTTVQLLHTNLLPSRE